MAAPLGRWDVKERDLFVHQIVPFDLVFVDARTVDITLLSNETNLSLFFEEPKKSDEIYATKRYYFKILAPTFRLPNAIVTTDRYSTTVEGDVMEAKELVAPDDFCAVLADKLEIADYEAVQYSSDTNLLVLKLTGQYANLKDFTLPMAKKEGIKEYTLSFPQATLIYYALLPNELVELRFSYFNTQKKEFQTITLALDVKDESVSTQSDIKPAADKNKEIKILLFASIAILFLFLFYLKRGFLFLLFGALALGYSIYLMIPLKKVCVKRGAKIYILPTAQSTIFKINDNKRTYIELTRVNGYTKIKLSDKKVGWVNDEDLCKN